jgi:hypothetical protein
MEQVIRAFLPWQTIAKNYFVETPTDVPVVSSAAPSKTVQFEEESEDEESDEEEEPPKLQISEETATLDVEDLDQQTVQLPVKEEDDPLKEIESKMSSETLVLNL